jgi:hypothetical protein
LVLACGLGLVQAAAQENVERGRTPAQLYASDCAECHRNPRVVGKTMSAGSLADYLRLHYTASKETAAAISAYLTALPADPRAGTARTGSAKPASAAKSRQATPAKPSDPASDSPAAAAPETPPPAAPAAAPASKPPESDAKPPP